MIPSASFSVMVCKMDPRQSKVCAKRQILGAATANLKGKGLEKKGLGTSKRRQILKKMPPIPISRKRSRSLDHDECYLLSLSPATSSSTHTHTTHPPPLKKKRRSADRDLQQIGGLLVVETRRTSRSISMSTNSHFSSPAPF